MMQTATERFEIRVKGHLGPSWSECLSGLEVINTPTGETILVGPIVDQAELYGVLASIRDLNLTLLSVTRIDSDYPSGDDQKCEVP
jgi:hypothetical protein